MTKKDIQMALKKMTAFVKDMDDSNMADFAKLQMALSTMSGDIDNYIDVYNNETYKLFGCNQYKEVLDVRYEPAESTKEVIGKYCL